MTKTEDNSKDRVYNDLYSICKMLDVDLDNEIELIKKEIDKSLKRA